MIRLRDTLRGEYVFADEKELSRERCLVELETFYGCEVYYASRKHLVIWSEDAQDVNQRVGV